MIDAAPLRADPRLVVERTFLVPPPAGGEGGRALNLRGPVAVHATLSNLGDRIRAEIGAEAPCEVPCDRCLQPVALDLDVHYAEEFVTPEQAAWDGMAGSEEDDGELRRVVFADDRIDLEPGLWQNLYLALPAKRLCREDCRGLCPRCGRSLNDGPCGCPPEDGPEHPLDPRLSVLAEAKRRMNGAPPRQGG